LGVRGAHLKQQPRDILPPLPAAGTATCAWMSMVTLSGRISRPGLPWRRAAVGSYLFQAVMSRVSDFEAGSLRHS
jgi:hypothetical protein